MPGDEKSGKSYWRLTQLTEPQKAALNEVCNKDNAFSKDGEKFGDKIHDMIKMINNNRYTLMALGGAGIVGGGGAAAYKMKNRRKSRGFGKKHRKAGSAKRRKGSKRSRRSGSRK